MGTRHNTVLACQSKRSIVLLLERYVTIVI